jgi:hypothetical protein
MDRTDELIALKVVNSFGGHGWMEHGVRNETREEPWLWRNARCQIEWQWKHWMFAIQSGRWAI